MLIECFCDLFHSAVCLARSNVRDVPVQPVWKEEKRTHNPDTGLLIIRVYCFTASKYDP